MRIHIKDIKKGDTFWEKTIKFVALEDTREAIADFSIPGHANPKQWFLNAQAISVRGQDVPEADQKPQRLLVTEGAEHYGPSFYTECAYVGFVF